MPPGSPKSCPHPHRPDAPVDDALHPGTVDGDHCMRRELLGAEQMADATEIPRTLFADRAGEQHRPGKWRGTPGEDPRQYHERSEAPGVVGNPGSLEPAPVLSLPDRDVHVGAEYGVEVCGQDHGGPAGALAQPTMDVAGVIDSDAGETRVAEAVDEPRRALAFQSRRGRDP